MSKFSKIKRLKVYNKYNGKCAYCGKDIEYSKMHIDHIIPKQRGFNSFEAEQHGITKGTDKFDNLNPSCASCNISKSTYSLDVWKTELKLKKNRLRRDVTNVRILESFGILEFNNKNILFYFER